MFYWILFFLPLLFIHFEFSTYTDKLYSYIWFNYAPLSLFIIINGILIALYFVIYWWLFAILSVLLTLFYMAHVFTFDVLWKWAGKFMYSNVPIIIYHIFICYWLVFFWNFNSWDENQLNSENLIIILGPIFMLSIKNGSFVALVLLFEVYGMYMEKVKEIQYVDRKPLITYYKYLDVLYLCIYVY